MIVINRENSISPRASFTDQLRQKSRLRRDRLERTFFRSTAQPRRNDVLPRLELSYIPVDHLRPSPKRVRKLDPAHVQEIAVAISALGFCDPLLVGRDNELINGEARYEAAKQLGLDRIPCVRIEHLSKDEQRVLRLAVNRLAERGQYEGRAGAEERVKHDVAAIGEIKERVFQQGGGLDGWMVLEASAGVRAQRGRAWIGPDV